MMCVQLDSDADGICFATLLLRRTLFSLNTSLECHFISAVDFVLELSSVRNDQQRHVVTNCSILPSVDKA